MDFAQLGIKLDTNDLEKGLRQLKQLQPTGAGAAAAADKLAKSLSGTALQAQKVAIETAKANKASAMEAIASGKLSKVKIAEQRAIIKAADAQIKASNTKAAHIKKLREEIALQKQVAAVTNAATAATAKNNAALAGVAGRFSGSGTRGFGVANDPANDMAPNRFNTANIAAQFQDIGVTAAMGMNPMTIALQQGTQLSAILNSMSGAPLKGLAAAFTSIINPVSLLSIGMVGLIAAGVQFVDWASVAESGASMLAGGFDFLAENADILSMSFVALTTSMVALNFTSIVGGIVSATTAMAGLAVATWAAVAPFAAAAAAAAGLLGFLALLNKWSGGKFVENLTNALNMAVGVVVGFVNTVGEVFRDSGLSKLIVGVLVSPIELAFNTAKSALNLFISGINKLIEKLPDWVRDKTGVSEIDFRFDVTNLSGDLVKEGAGQIFDIGAKEFGKTAGVDYVGGLSEGIKSVAASAADSLRSFVKDVADVDEKEKKDPYAEIVAGAKKRIATLKTERQMIGMSAQAANRLRIETELLNKAKDEGIDLTAEQTARLKNYAAETAALEERNRQLNESYDLLRDTGKGFFQDLRKGLQDGKSAWESFSDAVVNALNRVADKFFETSLDMVFDNVSGSSGGGGGIISGIADWLFSAKGNAFTSSGVEAFAKGGTFTNTVANSPTMFTFANGGKFGVMGEAGPEAVMPLRRGSDGSLGVQVVGGMGSSPVTVNVINNSGAQARTEQRQTSNGQEIDVIIDDIVASKIGSDGTASNRAVQEANNRPLIRRG